VKLAVCLHGGAVARTAMPLHPGDRALVALGRRLGLESIAVELLAAGGVAPRAVNEAADEGLARAVRVVDEALATADAPATGLVAERVLRDLKPDLIAFVAAADPEGVADVPAVLAFRLGAAYVPGAFELATTASAPDAPPGFTARAWRGAMEVTLALPRGAVLELDPASAPASVLVNGLALPAPRPPAPSAKPAPIRVVTLADLALDATLVRRRDDLRGVVEPAARPLVTTRSSTSLAALLR
jgi:hypothetical protein